MEEVEERRRRRRRREGEANVFRCSTSKQWGDTGAL